MNFKYQNLASRLLLGCTVLLASCSNPQNLFQENSNDWKEYGEGSNWAYSNNELTGFAIEQGSFVMTEQTFDNFILTLEFKPDSSVNSGVFIRCKEKNMSSSDCYEINIWDNHPNQASRTGSIVKKAPPLAIVNTNGKWNTYKIMAKGDQIKVWVNDTVTIDLNDSTLSNGYIGLQSAGKGEIKFRNIKVEPFL